MLDLKDVNFDVTFSKRRTIGISISPTLIVKIRAPEKTAKAKLERVIFEKKDWILKKLSDFKTNSKQMKTEASVYLLGKPLNIIKTDGKVKPKIEGDDVILSSSPIALKTFLRQQAEEVFNQRLAICFKIFNQKYDYELPDLSLRFSKNRLGSMLSFPFTKKGKMMLNINLIHFEVKFIDYVIFHELCHLKYKGHGKRFYTLQESFIPNWKELKKEISYVLF